MTGSRHGMRVALGVAALALLGAAASLSASSALAATDGFPIDEATGQLAPPAPGPSGAGTGGGGGKGPGKRPPGEAADDGASKVVAWASGVDVNPLGGDARGGIFVARENGTGVRKITTFQTSNRDLDDLHVFNLPDDHPSFSPDGRKIIFASNRADRADWDLYLMNVNGSGVMRLLDRPRFDIEPVISPDGAKVAWASDFRGNYDIWVMNLDGSGSPQLLTTSSAAEIEPAWSPDGTQIAYSAASGAHEKDVYVMNADGSGKRRLTFTPREDHDPSFSPDGERLAITSERPPTSPPSGNVHVIRVSDGADLGRLTADLNLGAGDPAWSHDGAKIAYFKFVFPFLGPAKLFTMDADGSDKLHLPGEGVVNVHPGFGRLADDNSNGIPNYMESGAVGKPRLRGRRMLRAGRTGVLRFSWRHPRRWTQLDELDLHVLDRRTRRIATIRFAEAERTFSLYDHSLGGFARSKRAGQGKLKQGGVNLILRRTRLIKTSKRTATLRLGLRFARRLARHGKGKRYYLAAHGRSDNGDFQRDWIAKIRVRR